MAALVGRGAPATIVAFGTSMTLGGQYLTGLPAAFAAAGSGPLTLVNGGLRGFISFWAAFHVPDDVLAYHPDLVIVEFAHNEIAPDAITDSGPALDGIIAQIRASAPACEFVFVYLASRGLARDGPSPAMIAQETVAEHYGIPSIDLATLTEELIADGSASWAGDGAPALTTDGIHHGALAERLLGIPFAAAFRGLLNVVALPVAAAPIRDRTYSNTSRRLASDAISAGSWMRGLPSNHTVRSVEAYGANIAVAAAADCALRVAFTGRQVYVWAMGIGVLTVAVEGRPERFHVPVESGDVWRIRALMPLWPPGDYVLAVSVSQPPVILGDLFIVGSPLPE